MSDDNDAESEGAVARFWDFSIAVYGAPDVAAACLALQDSLGLNINLLLFCCWSATEGTSALGGAKIAQAVAAIRPWQKRSVDPLRAIRRDLKNPVDGLDDPSRESFRKHVATIELEAERIAQRLLVAAVPVAADVGPALSERLAAGAANVVDYAASFGADPAAQRTGLTVVLSTALGVTSAAADLAIETAIRSRAAESAAL